MQKLEKKEKLINLYLKFLTWKQNKKFFVLSYNNIKKNSLTYFFNNNSFFFQKNFIKFFFSQRRSSTKNLLENNTSIETDFDDFFKNVIFKNDILKLSYDKLSVINLENLFSINSPDYLKKYSFNKKLLDEQEDTLPFENYLNYILYVKSKIKMLRYFKNFFFFSTLHTSGTEELYEDCIDSKLRSKKFIFHKRRKRKLFEKKKIKRVLAKKNGPYKAGLLHYANEKLNSFRRALSRQKNTYKTWRLITELDERYWGWGINASSSRKFRSKNNLNTQIFLFDNYKIKNLSKRLFFSLNEDFHFKSPQPENKDKSFYFTSNFIDVSLNFSKAMLFREKLLRTESLLRKFNCFLKISKNNLFFTLTNVFNETILTFSCRTDLEEKISKRIINSIYYTLPRFIAKIKPRIAPNEKIENFFLPLHLMRKRFLIKNIFKQNKLTIENIRVKQIIKHNNFLKLKKLSRKKRLR